MKFRDWDLNLKVRLAGEILFNCLFWMYFPFMTLYFVDEFGAAVTGFLMMIPPVLAVFSDMYGGYCADRFGRKRMMIIAVGGEALLLLVFAFSPFPALDFIAFVLLAITGSLYHPACMAMVADLVPVDQRRPVFAVFYAAMNIGVVFGPILGAIFFFQYRTQLILTSAAVSAVLFVIMAKVFKETLPASAREQMQGMKVMAQFKQYGVIFRDITFLLYLLAGVLVAQIFMQLDLYLGVYLKAHVTEQPFLSIFDWQLTVNGEKLFGWMLSVNGLMVVLFTLLATKLVSTWSDQRVLVVSSLLFGLSFWFMAFSQNAWWLIGCMVLFTIAELIRTPVIQNFITRIAPEEKRGQYMGASSLQFSVGRAVAPIFVTLSAFLPPLGITSIIFLCGILGALIYVLMFHVYEKAGADKGKDKTKSHGSPEPAKEGTVI